MLAQRLAWLRHSRSLTQDDVARELGISRSRYSHYEVGRSEPDIDMIRKIANLYNVSSDFLLGLQNSPRTLIRDLEKIFYHLENQNIKNQPSVLHTVKKPETTLPKKTECDCSKICFSFSKAIMDKEYFCAEVTGNDMEPKICSGDFVVIRRQSWTEPGDLAVVILDNQEDAIIKKVFLFDDSMLLFSIKHDSNPLRIALNNITIIGKVVFNIAAI